MDSFSDDDEGSEFFDSKQISPEIEGFSDNWEYDVWVNSPQSVTERRRRFISWMGFSRHQFEGEIFVDSHENDADSPFVGDTDRIVANNGAVLRTSSNEEDELSSSGSSSWNTADLNLCRGTVLDECRNVNGNASHRRGFEMVENKKLQRIQVKGPDNMHQSSRKVDGVSVEANGYTPRTMGRLKERWMRKLRSITCSMAGNAKADREGFDGSGQAQSTRIRRVCVRHCRRKLKELSGLFTGQDIEAHEGSILAMKFSFDGQYLATAGEDKLVKIWKVVEDERLDAVDIPDADPSCVFLSLSNLSELAPLTMERDAKFKNLRKTSDSACVVIPPKVFRILEKPLHVFEGHTAEILDLSWSKNNCLLSSSMDKTARLWKIGLDHCLKVFHHTDYVTCIQFHPMNDDYFISGSIDGKVRIWTTTGCQVVYWTETRDIITAICYHPNGQGGIVGFITGTYRFFKISDECLQLEAEVCLNNKKSTSRRITGFQFFPQDPSKVLVASADSQVRIIEGMNVICKYKGFRNSGNHPTASLTSDGNHIISASEDSNIYMWNYFVGKESFFSQPRVTKSFECFSSDASVAIPWPGMNSSFPGKNSTNPLPFSSSTQFSLTQEFLLDSGSKGSATWPEEKLPMPSPKFATSLLSKSQYKLFKTCYQSSSNAHAWGLVVVTAGWDGRIRSFQNYGLPVPL
ncbi:uncharacterized protein LOC127259343 [Andrographis paniculata]|uniref:uncharacterized protein LOC127259343 n=1 Tax=Andrographis paniculata TaxID=175694 RepID=UPI0021E93FDE|nr:uncharacterized protein LOC127259343 [Andrographis paniculata]